MTSKENLYLSKYLLSKTGKFRRGSQGNHPAAFSKYEEEFEFCFAD